MPPSAGRMTGVAGSRRHGLRVLAILGALMAFASISTDLYLPALPAMAEALGADGGAMELTITGYLVGFSLGQLLWGPVGDRYGRRLPILVGLALFVIGSAGCALSSGVGEMTGWRIVQAVGACSGVVLARAMVRDLYSGARAAQMLSTLMTVMAVAPLIGPLVGGQILRVAPWGTIFWTLVGVGVATALAVLTLPETLPSERRNMEPLRLAGARYLRLVRDRRVLGCAGVGGFFFGGTFAYVAGTPFAYINHYHVPPQLYGLLFGAGVLGIMATNLVNARLVVRLGEPRLMRVGTAGAALSAAAAATNVWTGWGGLAGLAVPLLCYLAMTGFIVANSISEALATFPEQAGAVSALVGAAQYGGGVIGSGLVGAFADGTPWPLGWVIAAAATGAAACAYLIVPRGSGASEG